MSARGKRNAVDPWRPYHFLVEPEYSAKGQVEDVATVFLTNRECPYKCLMCDLWKNTLEHSVPPGAIPAQIDFALQRLASAGHIKLYNSGNFFDGKAVPPSDLRPIAERVRHFQTVIVENHPRLCGPHCGEFQQLLGTQLEIALGLETSHEPTLATLNKQMTTADFARACRTLLAQNIRIRAFVLLRPPGLSEQAAIEQAIESVRFAFGCGVSCVTVIPVRAGNGILDRLQQSGHFSAPALRSLEAVLEETLGWKQGRVFADTWDAAQFADCAACSDTRIRRLQTMNLTQHCPDVEECSHCQA